MESIQKTLQWISDNWSAIVGIVILIYGIYLKAKMSYKSWKEKTEEEKKLEINAQIERAKSQVKQIILKLCFEAEVNFEEYVKAGYTKRSEVLRKIYQELPVLQSMASDEEFIKWVDEQIDEVLVIVRETIANKTNESIG